MNSSGAYGAAKLWPVEYFGRVARRVVDELDHDVLVTCGPKERRDRPQVVRLAAGDRVSRWPTSRWTWHAKACIRRCRWMVSTDSGPRHVAAAFGLPVVTLFGPMLPVWSENPTQRAVNLCSIWTASAATSGPARWGTTAALRELSVERVFAAAKRSLEGRLRKQESEVAA